ncbi:MAG: ribosome silencing factor [Elusimicrobia bacterium RIFOXYA2_FULL_58_8]|nr:MAG: ribosome silencing factor [Elusimicrobia bacterium RIFOXYA12_FULL_57_11]OGS16533.1 MAG: ribosome silencing factor [Elusimicrobia bacterium RIFOXYA2_FULL_58_8]
MTLSKNDSKKIAVTAALAGDSKKASPVGVFDLGARSSLADFAVLLAVESAPQLEAVEEEVLVRLKQDGIYCLYKDGMRSKNWKVLDYGGVLVHIFDGKAAEFYSIEQLYGECKPVQWQANAPVAKKPAAKKAVAKKAAQKKPAVRKPAAKKGAVKKSPAKKTSVKKPAAKKAARAKKPSRKK